MATLHHAKQGFNLLWLSTILFGIGYSIYYPNTFTAENISLFLEKFGAYIWLGYIFITFMRGVFLFPSTPFVIAGAILFPKQLLLVGIVSIVGILFSATLLYFFAEKMGFGDYLTSKYPHKIERVKKQLNTKKGKWLVALWALFPLVPTDIICYVAGLVQMKYYYMLGGIFVGELLLVSIYLFLFSYMGWFI